jgi:integrase
LVRFLHGDRRRSDLSSPLLLLNEQRGGQLPLLSMGVPAKVVQEVLGHSKINTTLDIYGHVLSEMQRDAMDKMGDFFGEEL